MPVKIKAPTQQSVLTYMRELFLTTEQKIIDEIARKREQGYVDYAEVATLTRIQKTLQTMVDTSWVYVPKMIEKYFYTGKVASAGYENAMGIAAVSTGRLRVIEQLTDNLLGEIQEMADVSYQSSQKALADLNVIESGGVPVLGRLTADPFREGALTSALTATAAGKGSMRTVNEYLTYLQNNGITAFVDKSGRNWSLHSYGNMAVRTTARQAQVSAQLTADDHDLYKIVKIGSTCPICAPLEGRVYSKSGMNPNYPPLALAFGKIDPAGSDDLSNTFLNIHPNCLHSIVKYTEASKTPEEIQRIREFSNPETNPLSHDPRSKRQIKAYQEKERNRAKLRADMKQMHEYANVLGSRVPKDVTRFRKLKYEQPEKWKQKERAYRTVRELGRKASWSNEFRSKAIDTYFNLLDKDVEFSGHGIARFLDRSPKHNTSIDDIVKQSKMPFNYSQKDGKKIKFYNQMALVYNENGSEIVTLVWRNGPKGDWNEST